MTEGNVTKFMASRLWLGMFGFNGIMFYLNCFMSMLTRQYFDMTMHFIVGSLSLIVAYKYFMIPAVEIHDNFLVFTHRPIFTRKSIAFSDVLDFERTGKKFRLILKNRDKITIPIRWLKKEDRDSAVSLINSKIP